MVNIKVAVRIRPLSQRESLRGEEVIVRKENKSVLVNNPKIPEKQDGDSRQRIRRFAVDFCYDPKEPEGCSQEAVYNEIGLEVLDSMFKGYNACVLAYGHSASGKTYTIMGLQDDPGLTPRLCQGLFEKLNKKRPDEDIRVQIIISFLEIYNEKVRDLLGSEELGATSGNFSLRVREHPKLGPYVQGLSRHLVTDKRNLVELLTTGNRRRSTAATENNIHSSRSHAVFTIQFKQSDGINYETEKSSKVHLVDLAGSERASSSQSKARLKEGANINKSLVTLGNVISALAESCESERLFKVNSKSWQPFVPYRDSVLTWLLKDTLGGNSNTIMIASLMYCTDGLLFWVDKKFFPWLDEGPPSLMPKNVFNFFLSTPLPENNIYTTLPKAVSPGSGSLNETVNTLRYAKRTKRIINQPIVNEDPKIRTIRQLRKEIARLRHLLFSFQSCGSSCGFEENNFEGVIAFSSPESKWLDSGGTIITIKEENNNKKENLEKAFIIKKGEVNENKTNEDEEKGKKVENEEFSTLNKYETGVLRQRAAPPVDDACKINDAKKSDVNGSFKDNFSHETLIFPDSLESFSSIFLKRENSCDVDTDANDDGSRRYGVAEFACESCEFSAENLNFCLTGEFGSYESLSKKDFSMMLRRSRPDLIKGISTRSKEGLPLESSQSCTDMSNLSQSTSENSLYSSGKASEKKRLENLASHTPKSLEVEKEKTKISAKVRTDQGKEPLPILMKKKEKRSEIVDAVTSRLYVTKKKPDRRTEISKKKKEEEKKEEDNTDEELEELKLCRRARMKLFDLSRKLAMTRRIKKTVDNDTQTDSLTATLRLKEKCIATDMRGLGDYILSEESSKEEEKPCVIMNQVFIPKASNYVVECGKVIRIEAPKMEDRYESATQTSPESRSYKNANTSPIKFSSQEEDCFSEDSLDSEDKNRSYNQTVTVLFSGEERKTQNESDLERNMSFNWAQEAWLYFPYDSEARFRKEFQTLNFSKIKKSKETLFEKMSLTDLTENKISSNEEMGFAADYASNSSLEELRKENNPSSENSLNSIEGTDISCSSETTSEDFVFFENSKDFALKTKATSDRELYTITENSEHSDPSDTFSPVQSQVSFFNASNEDEKKEEAHKSSQHRLQANRFRSEKKIKQELEMFDQPKEIRELPKNNDDRVESELEIIENKNETLKSGKVSKNFAQSFSLNKSKPEKSEIPKSISVITPTIVSKNSDPQPSNFAKPRETKDTYNETEKKNLDSEGIQIRMDDIKKRSNQTNWKDFQSSSQKQYLNLNISNSARASPIFVDTHLFGESLQKDQSTDTMFNSADSITFVFMGPAKPKTSVLMEIIQRSLISEVSFSQEKLRDEEVCSENLMRSVSMDTAMIALSRIAKNQEPSKVQKSCSLETLTSNETKTSLEQEKVHIQRETDCPCSFKCFKREKKHSVLKNLVNTNVLVDEQTINKTTKSSGTEEVEKTKKSVSWSGEAQHLGGLKSRALEKTDELEVPNFDSEHQDSLEFKAQEFNEENSHKLLQTNREFGPPERRVRFLKPETWIGSATEPTESLTAFLKEAIQLLKNLNFCSAQHQMFSNETMEKFGDEINRKKKENDKRGFKKFKNSDLIRRDKTESCSEKSESRRSKIRTGANERKTDEGHFNLTWPRRRQRTEKLPTRMKPKFSRSFLPFRSNLLHSNDSLNSTINSSQSNRMASSGQSWNTSNLSLAFSSSHLGENQNRPPSSRSSFCNETKRLRDSYFYPIASQGSSIPKLNFDSVSELGSDLEEACRRLEMAAEQDKMREHVVENWEMGLQGRGHETEFWAGNDDMEEEYQATERKTKEVVKRRKTKECIGGCTCKASKTDPCKYLWSRGCRSSFELDSFGPGSAHCQQLCMFCRKKDEEIYYSALCLNSECISAALCRLNFYGFCPCSSFRLSHVASSPRAYLQHLLALRRQIVNETKRQELFSVSRDEHAGTKHKNSCSFFSRG